ncbi:MULTISPECIES: AAA family ATPase [Enterobacteriaceae]|uniref:AAA family ATPase n=1 Tax=Enterobacteriaceae TaxID=543 RepID=UPI0006657009|nr:AAA family ATPase [Enterobacter asburiae]
MKLISIKIKGRDIVGLESEELIFGTNITEFYGPNGCGKTPLLQSISYCLGYPCKFRDDIYKLCKSATLTFTIANNIFRATRDFENTDFILTLEQNEETLRFYNQADYSKHIFELLSLSYPSLLTTQNKQSYPYLSTILPIFYLDQDLGYSKFYYSPGNFIRDQFSEMLRIVFSLPEKHSFDAKKKAINITEEIKYLDNSLAVQRRNIEIAKETHKDKNIEAIDSSIDNLKNELSELKNSKSLKNDSLFSIEAVIKKQKENLNDLKSKLNFMERRESSLLQIMKEINTEIETLNLNEEAKRIFRSFEEICPSLDCKMFSRSSESYAKHLLYLKDQIKDIERSLNLDSDRHDKIEQEIIYTSKTIEDLSTMRNNIIEEEDISSVIDAISEISSMLFKLQLEKNELNKITILEDKYIEMLNKREYALDELAGLEKNRQSIPRLAKIKTTLRDKFINWLKVLKTPNIDFNVTFENDFSPIMGYETLEQLKGSTKVRAILAYRTALIESMLELDCKSFMFAIFDTPKQHEIHYEDIDNFIMNLKTLSKRYNFQFIFSSTEYKYEGDTDDVLLTPKYPGEQHNMFLMRY